MSDRSRTRPAVLGAVLAGGAGSRFGRPKASVELGGRPLIAHVLDAVAAAGLDPVVVAKPSSRLPELSCPILLEPEQPRHPLCGILCALRASNARPVIAVACDMPFVTPPLLAWLASLDERLAVCETEAGLHPLLARYDPSLIGALEQALLRAEPMREAVSALGPHLVGEPELRRFGSPERLTFNVNDISDLEAAERLAARAPPAP